MTLGVIMSALSRPPVRALLLPILLALIAGAASFQAESRLLRRWVGTHQGQALWLDFYGDTMLVINDDKVASFRTNRGRLDVWGPDTTFTVSYWYVLDRLLLRTAEGDVVTMAPQDSLARPLTGDWRGSAFGSNRELELWMGRGGVARWRELSGGGWNNGEWDRASRLITFTWLPDSVMWAAQYDPGGSALIVTGAEPDSATVILRRAYRW
jgi:hypothetical protein